MSVSFPELVFSGIKKRAAAATLFPQSMKFLFDKTVAGAVNFNFGCSFF
jgi:hypothetical protein